MHTNTFCLCIFSTSMQSSPAFHRLGVVHAANHNPNMNIKTKRRWSCLVVCNAQLREMARQCQKKHEVVCRMSARNMILNLFATCVMLLVKFVCSAVAPFQSSGQCVTHGTCEWNGSEDSKLSELTIDPVHDECMHVR